MIRALLFQAVCFSPAVRDKLATWGYVARSTTTYNASYNKLLDSKVSCHATLSTSIVFALRLN